MWFILHLKYSLKLEKQKTERIFLNNYLLKCKTNEMLIFRETNILIKIQKMRMLYFMKSHWFFKIVLIQGKHICKKFNRHAKNNKPFPSTWLSDSLKNKLKKSGLEFNSVRYWLPCKHRTMHSTHTNMLGCWQVLKIKISVLGNWSQASSWGSLSTQPNLMN